MTKYELLELLYKADDHLLTDTQIESLTEYDYCEFQMVIDNLELKNHIHVESVYPQENSVDDLGRPILSEDYIIFQLTPLGKDAYLSLRKQNRLTISLEFRSWAALAISIIAITISLITFLK